MFPVDQRKTRSVAAAAKPDGDKTSASEPKSVGESNKAETKLKENKKDNKPEDQKKEEQTKEEPAPAVEAKKEEENKFDVSVVCVSALFVICGNQFLTSYLFLAEEDQPTDFSFGQS